MRPSTHRIADIQHTSSTTTGLYTLLNAYSLTTASIRELASWYTRLRCTRLRCIRSCCVRSCCASYSCTRSCCRGDERSHLLKFGTCSGNASLPRWYALLFTLRIGYSGSGGIGDTKAIVLLNNGSIPYTCGRSTSVTAVTNTARSLASMIVY